jgi:RNA polymerase-binding transcription factor DksA
VPWATLCIRCQEAADRGHKEMRPLSRDLPLAA